MKRSQTKPRQRGWRRRITTAVLLLAGATSASAAQVEVDLHRYHWATGSDADFFTGVVLTEDDPVAANNYAAIVSKYIGETEKPLGAVFAAQGQADAALLFDDSDALFGKPTDPGNPNDPHADDFVAFLPDSGRWFGQLYVDFDPDVLPGVYALTGEVGSFTPVTEPGAFGLVALALIGACAGRSRRLSTTFR